MKLFPQEQKQITIYARDYYSRESLEVIPGQVYDFSVEKWPLWVDFFVTCNANGFWNPILANSKKRVKNVPCYKLCGTIGKAEDNYIVIGQQSAGEVITREGCLYFFANDHYKEKYYKNNWGHILLNIKRVK